MRPGARATSRATLPDGADLGKRAGPAASWKLLARAAGDQHHHRRHRGRAVDERDIARSTTSASTWLVAVVVAFTLSLRAHGPAGALDPRADRSDLRAATERVARRRPHGARAGRSAPTRPGKLARVVQRRWSPGWRSASAARGVRRVRRSRRSPSACSPRATSLEGEEVEVTVLFLDIRDFTAFAEHASAPRSSRTLNELLRARRARAAPPRRPRQQVHRRRAARRSSARPTGSPTTPTARSRRRWRSPTLVRRRVRRTSCASASA